ncbi:hypothetical protein [Fictibacillus phosphorivorans]|uniref:hypothetical protein n=1 Tax=Fictibacillus phosphorivorans TaxID=1221500 RepID=UPI0009EDA4DB|nr:hypothetical protein [Fictibacillus phosphorivorans]
MFLGLFSFSIDLPLFNTFVKIPILPLGVWILYFIFRNKVEKWIIYRRFAWLGFFANFIFLAATFAAIPLHHALYPEQELSTFIAKTDQARLFPLHTGAKESTLNKEVFVEQLSKMNAKPINSMGWYNEIVNIDVPQEERKEKFPYQITGTEPKWGSGLNTTLFVEQDGKGLLLTTQKKQYYFRSDVSFVEGLE